MAKEVVQDNAAQGQKKKADKDIAHTTRGNIKHYDEEDKEEKSASEVSFKNNYEKAYAPHDKKRKQHLQARNTKRSDCAHGDGQGFSVYSKVKGKKEDECYFCDFSRLEGE